MSLWSTLIYDLRGFSREKQSRERKMTKSGRDEGGNTKPGFRSKCLTLKVRNKDTAKGNNNVACTYSAEN